MPPLDQSLCNKFTPWGKTCILPKDHGDNLCDTSIDRGSPDYLGWADSSLATQHWLEWCEEEGCDPDDNDFNWWVTSTFSSWMYFREDMYAMQEVEDSRVEEPPVIDEDLSWADTMAAAMVSSIHEEDDHDHHHAPTTAHAGHVFRYEVLDDDDGELTLVIHVTPEGLILDLTDPESGKVISTFGATAQELADDFCH